MGTYTTDEARKDLQLWLQELKENLLSDDDALMHTYQIYFSDEKYLKQLKKFATNVSHRLEPAVMENNQNENLPGLSQYNSIGERADEVIHHPSYTESGDIIYGSGLMKHLSNPGEMLKTLGLFLLSSHAGEAGHNCPIACSAGVMRILSMQRDLPQKEELLEKLAAPSFRENYTGAQFLTEIQGGSDVGANSTVAYQDNASHWRIQGEKWFCSNANAELILMTARHDEGISGTKGLGLFLVPANLPDGSPNHYKIKRLKSKIGTRSMATAEVEFEGAVAYLMGTLDEGINLVMENVLHLSRIFNAFSVLGMSRRAFQIAFCYAKHRSAFEHKIITYPLVQDVLANIKSQVTAMIASSFYMVKLQDDLDIQTDKNTIPQQKLLLRTLANINKYYTAKHAVENIHHCLDILAGNGTIEDFSSLPRLLRDSIVCENWEGTHFVLWMQVLRDIHKFQVDELFITHVKSIAEQVDTDEKNKAWIEKQIQQLEKSLSDMKAHSLEQQTLKFKPIIKQMGYIFSAVCLMREIQRKDVPPAKKAALELYLLNQERTSEDVTEHYMSLCCETLNMK